MADQPPPPPPRNPDPTLIGSYEEPYPGPRTAPSNG